MFYEGGNLSFVVFLPNRIDGLYDMVDKLQDARIFDEVYSNMRNVEVNVYLPKIKTNSEYDLKEVLKKVSNLL